jgi:hypothetical protein
MTEADCTRCNKPLEGGEPVAFVRLVLKDASVSWPICQTCLDSFEGWVGNA